MSLQNLEVSVSRSTQLKPLPKPDELFFGRHFTDHWFQSFYSEGDGWQRSAILPYGKSPLDPAASVLHYGQALFEGMKAFAQPDESISLFRPDFNYRRLVRGAERLCLVPPSQELFMTSLSRLISLDARWVPKEKGQALYLRPTLAGIEPFLGVRPAKEIIYFVILSPVGSYFNSMSGHIKIWVEEKELRAVPGGLGDVKAAANYAASLHAAHLAKQRGCDQVLWLDFHREGIEEVGTMNIFFVFKDEIITPALSGSILPGGMRDSILQILRHEKKRVSERRITINEVIERQKLGDLIEAFGTGTAAIITPVSEFVYRDKSYVLNDKKIGPMSRWLYDCMTNLQAGLAPDPFGWMVPLNSLR